MDMKQEKNALVASLFELSNAANDAAVATVNFYKKLGGEGGKGAGQTLAQLGDAVSEVVKEVAASKARAIAEKADASQSTTADEPEHALSSEEASAESLAKPQKTKRKRAEKDPNAPKKPLTTYLRFSLSAREDLKKQRSEENQPNLPASMLNKIVAEKWANLGEPEKEELQKAYDAELQQYKKDFDAYKVQKERDDGPSAAPSEDADAATPKPAAKKQAVEEKTPKNADAESEASSQAHETTAVPKKGSASKSPGKTPASSQEAETATEEKKKKHSKRSGEHASQSDASQGLSGTPTKKSKKKKDSEEKKHKQKRSEQLAF